MKSAEIRHVLKNMRYDHPLMYVDAVIRAHNSSWLHAKKDPKDHNATLPLTTPIEGIVQTILLFIYIDGLKKEVYQRGIFKALHTCDIRHSATASDAIIYRIARCKKRKGREQFFAGAAFASGKLIAKVTISFLVI